MQATRICSLTECDRPHFGRGLCQRHLERKRREDRKAASHPRCSIDTCEDAVVGRGWCEGHYRRFLEHGDPQGGRRSPATGPCSADLCERPVAAQGWCALHYYRWKRTGLLEVPAFTDPGCLIEDCQQPHASRGWCRLHYERWRTNGDPLAVLPSSRDLAGELSPNWHGDEVTYSGMHIRLRRTQGTARKLSCVDCNGEAAHWSYDHTDLDEVTEDGIRFSLKAEHYEPRCSRCHIRFDRRKPATR